jgi:hypothetical protein
MGGGTRPGGILVAAATAILALGLVHAPAAGAVHKHRTKFVPTTIELEGGSPYSPGGAGSPLYVVGSISTSPINSGCRAGRTVTLHGVTGGSDFVLGKTTSYKDESAPGGLVSAFFRVDFTQPGGSYQIYAAAERKALPHVICKYDETERISYRG